MKLSVHKSLQNSRSKKGAFTLVETVLAIGIVSTVMIALMGLIPLGMKMMSAIITVKHKVNAPFLDREFCKDLCTDNFMALIDANY
jgi:hypothetical protein